MECRDTASTLVNRRRSNLLEEPSVLHEMAKTTDAMERLGSHEMEYFARAWIPHNSKVSGIAWLTLWYATLTSC